MSTMSPVKLARLNDLLVAFAAGDTHAFSEFYAALAPLVYGVTLHVLRNPALAEEVAQDVFVEVWSKAAHFDPARGSARTWVGRIAHGRAALRGDDVETDALDRVESQRLRAPPPLLVNPTARRWSWPSSVASPTPSWQNQREYRWAPQRRACAMASAN